MPNILDEYLVKLGAVVDASGMARFQQALRETSMLVDANAVNMAKSALKIEGALVGAFATVGLAAIGLADKVAMADQEYRLFALHMYMSKDAARSLKVAMDALGQPLENLAWDSELRERTRQLIADQRAMAPGGDFDGQMRKIRDIRFEFTRMEVEMQYLGMNVVNDFMRALGGGPDWALGRLRAFNDWVIQHMPRISAMITSYLVPVLKDVWMIMKDAFQVGVDFARLFESIVGILSGDPTLEGAASFDKFARSVATVAHWIAVATDLLLKFVGTLTGTVGGAAVGGVLGSIIGGIAGIPGGPVGIGAGIVAGGATGTLIGGGVGAVGGGLFDLYRNSQWHGAQDGGVGALLSGLAPSNGGFSPALINAMIRQESGGNPNAVSPKGAVGMMQLMPKTAAALGVNPYDKAQNVAGGTAYMRQLMARYGGNLPEALGAYNAGPGRMDAFLAGKATLPDETKNYIASVLGRAGGSGSVTVGSVTINITQPNASAAQIQRAVSDGLQDANRKQVQRNLQEFSLLSPSY